MMVNEQQLESFTGAWATPTLIGRTAIRKQIDDAVKSDMIGPGIVLLYGPGGIGKTRLLTDTLMREEFKRDLSVARELIDVYEVPFHSDIGLADAIHAALRSPHAPFSRYEDAREALRRVQGSGNFREIAEGTEKALTAFSDDIRDISAVRRVVLALDTAERLVYGVGLVEAPFEIAQSWQWLSRSLSEWGNVTVLVAGRPPMEMLVEQLQATPSVTLTPIEVGPFTPEESEEYLAAVADAADQHGAKPVADALRTISPKIRSLAHQYSEGQPILLALLVDHMSVTGLGRLPRIFDEAPPPEQARALLEDQVFKRLRESPGMGDTLDALGRAPNGVYANMLSSFLDECESNAQDRLERIQQLSFVKFRKKRFFLHDEMYTLLHRQVYADHRDAPEAERVNRIIIARYQEQIDALRQELDRLYAPMEGNADPRARTRVNREETAEALQELERLLTEQMYYQLRLDPVNGFKEYYRHTFFAILTGSTRLDIQLQAELLAFIDEFQRNRHVEQPGDPERAEQLGDLERAVATGVVAARRVARPWAENHFQMAIDEAERMRREWGATLKDAGGTTNIAVSTWEALARAALGGAQNLQRARSLLDSNLAVLRPLVAATPQSGRAGDARHWRSRNLLALTYHARGYLMRVLGRLRDAVADDRRGAALWRQVDLPICLAWTLNNMGYVVAEEGDWVNARANVEEALNLRRRIGARGAMGYSYSTLALINLREGNYTEAILSAERAVSVFNTVLDRRGSALALRGLAEAKRRYSGVIAHANERVRLLREAHDHAADAYEIFQRLNEAGSQVEALIEEGCAYRDWARVRVVYPNPGDDPGRLVQRSADKLELAARLAKGNNLYRYVDALVNLGFLGLYVDRVDLVKRGIQAAEEAIPSAYRITETGRPDPDSEAIQVKVLLTQIAKLHVLHGHFIFEQFLKTRGSNQPVTAMQVTSRHDYQLHMLPDEEVAAARSPVELLDRTTYHYVLALEYNTLYSRTDPGMQRAQNQIDERFKELGSEGLEVVAQSVACAERDYKLGASVLRELLVNRALLDETLFDT